MRNLVIAGAIAGAAALAGAVPASAAVVDLTFSGTGISGLLVLSVSNPTSPSKVTSVGAGSYVDIGGTTYAITGLTSYAGDDQTLYPGSASVSYVDFPGLSVSFGSGDALNLFAFNPSSYGVLLKDNNPNGDPMGGNYYAVTVSDPPTGLNTPEHTTWAMMLRGLAGLGFVAARRRKTPIAALG